MLTDHFLAPPPAAASPAAFAFGPFRLHGVPPRLMRADAELRLGGRALALLLALVKRPGEILSRELLEAEVWPDTIVEGSSLRVHVAALRRTLGDGVDGARYIANVPGRGYSFVAPVARLDASTPAVPPAATTAPAVADSAGNLPFSLTRLIGRDAVVAVLSEKLARRRLVSIVGHGGIGKTSLALAVAGGMRQRFPAGVRFVDLAPVTGAQHVAETIASALGLSMLSGSLMTALEEWLRPRRALLVIDNCEHLLDTVAALVERLLAGAPQLVVLATSREPLGAEGEWVHRIAPLETPEADVPLDSAAALDYSAVQLLAERAVASLDNFRIDAGNVALAAALCRRLDGVPLAIEFAASRIGLLGLQGVCAQLDDRLRLLGSGRRRALPRHRTLRALLDWSHDLLSVQQQAVLRRCGVFKGGFALEAAGAVAADPGLPEAVVRDCLLDLVAKSLVRVDLAQTPPSYSLLEITRAYALERLDADPDARDVYRRHAQYVAALVQRHAAACADVVPLPAFHAYAAHAGNVRAALEWCFGADGDPVTGIALLGADVHPIALFLGEQEFRAYTRRALTAIDAGAAVTPIQAGRIFGIAQYFSTEADSQSAIDRLLGIAERDNDPEARVEALYLLHVHAFGRGNYDLCERYASASEAAARACGHAEVLHARRLRALALHYGGDHTRAAVHASALVDDGHAQPPWRLTGWLPRRTSMQIVMARVLWMQGEGRRAVALAAECVVEAGQARFPAALSQAICLAALPVALWQGDDAHACHLLAQLDVHLAHHPQQYWSGWAVALRQVPALRGAAAGALVALPDQPDAKLLDHLLSFGAWNRHEMARARWRQGKVGWTGPEVLRVEGELLLRIDPMDRDGKAQACLMRAVALADAQRAHAWALRASNSLARLWLLQGRAGAAHALLAPAQVRLDAMGVGSDVAMARSLLDRR